MKPKQAVSRFKKAGVQITSSRGKGGHTLLRFKGRQAILPMHGGREVPKVLLQKICKQLGLDPKDVL